MNFDFKQFLHKQRTWVEHNFPLSGTQHQLMGIVEEVGELSHSLLKQAQKIRGSHDEHEIDAQDAVGDIIIYTSSFLIKAGFSAQRIEEYLWNKLGGPRAGAPGWFESYLKMVSRLGHLCEQYPDTNVDFLFITSRFVEELNSVCLARGWDAREILARTWEQVVSKRDWKANPNDGK